MQLGSSLTKDVITALVSPPAAMLARSPAIRSRARRLLHVAIRSTPNPLAKEFVPAVPLLPRPDVVLRLQRSRLDRAELHETAPLAAKLVGMEHVSEVLLATDRVTINAEHVSAWDAIEQQTTAIISEALQCGPMPETAVQALGELVGGATRNMAWPEGSVEAEIVDVLEVHVRPYVREDGGDLRFCSFDHEQGVARVQLVGACSGCPSSAATLHGRVEQLLKHFVPEVEAVEQCAWPCKPIHAPHALLTVGSMAGWPTTKPTH